MGTVQSGNYSFKTVTKAAFTLTGEQQQA